jgi:hypothetical protein
MSVMNLRFIQGICHQVATQMLTRTAYVRNLQTLYEAATSTFLAVVSRWTLSVSNQMPGYYLKSDEGS